MNWLIEQILTLLASEAGGLAYHLILAFSIAGALQIAFTQSSRFGSDVNRRLVSGLALLLLLRIALFVSSGLVFQGELDGRLWLPLFDRTVALLSLILITWMWCFPRSVTAAESAIDSTVLVIGFIALIGSIFASMWWIRISQAGMGVETALNRSTIDIYFQTAALVIIAISLIMLIRMQPSGWGYGFTMLLLLGIGHLLHLLLPYGGDLPFALRLFEITAYPFLLMLPQRQILESDARNQANRFDSDTGEMTSFTSTPGDFSGGRTGIEPQIMKSLLGLLDDLPEDQACRRVAAALASAGEAESVFLAAPPESNGQLRLLCGYDQRTQRFMDGTTLDSSALPILAACLRMGRVRRLGAANTSPDRLALAKIYGIEKAGTMLFVPVLASDGKALAGAILAAGSVRQDWTLEEQSNVGLLAKFLVQFLQRARETSEMRAELGQSQQAARRIQDQAQQALEDDLKLRDQIAVLQENARRDQDQVMKMSALISGQADLQKALSQAENKIHRLQDKIHQLQDEIDRRNAPLAGELRMALEEISFLRTAVADADGRLAAIHMGSESERDRQTPSTNQLQSILAITEDLRQPLASIAGYTDVLLGESVGILGSNQRRYLERIRLSIGRFGRLLEELSRVTLVEADPERIERQDLDLCQVIHDAVQDSAGMMELRRLSLKLGLPERPLQVQSDPNALYRVVTALLRNAGEVTPEGGEIAVNAWMESGNTRPGGRGQAGVESSRDYALIQVGDQGAGIEPQDLVRVFSPRMDGAQETALVNGAATERIDFVRIKTLVESLGGRIWVDGEPGHGSKFSVLLPTSLEKHPETDYSDLDFSNPDRNAGGETAH